MKQTPFTLSNGVCLLPTAVGMKVKAREWREGVRLKTSLNERRIEGKTQETESVTCNFPLRWDCCCRNFSWSRRSDCGITSLTLSSSVKIKVLILAGDSKYEYTTLHWLTFFRGCSWTGWSGGGTKEEIDCEIYTKKLENCNCSCCHGFCPLSDWVFLIKTKDTRFGEKVVWKEIERESRSSLRRKLAWETDWLTKEVTYSSPDCQWETWWEKWVKAMSCLFRLLWQTAWEMRKRVKVKVEKSA